MNEEKKEQQYKEHPNKKLMGAVALLGLVMVSVIIVTMLMFRNSIRESAALMAGTQGQEHEGYYVLITEDEDSEFWSGILEGATKEAESKGILLERAGAQMNHSYTKYEQMEMAIYSKVDGIILDAGEDSRITNLIHQAYAAGIPVVTVRNDNTSSERVSFVSFSNASLSREYGAKICEIAREKLKNTQGPVRVCVLLDADSTNSNQSIVLTGIQDYISNQNMADQVQIETTQIHSNSVFSTEEEIRDLFMRSDGRIPADIMVCMNLQNTTCVYQTVLDYNLVGKVEILGFYSSDTIRSALEKDIIRATIMVDTRQMGRDCVDALTEFRQSGYVSDYYAVELFLVTSQDAKEGARYE